MCSNLIHWTDKIHLETPKVLSVSNIRLKFLYINHSLDLTSGKKKHLWISVVINYYVISLLAISAMGKTQEQRETEFWRVGSDLTSNFALKQ